MNPATSGSSRAPRTAQTAAPSLGFSSEFTPSNQKCETYDIAFAGPRNRYSVLSSSGPVIAHNCGYGIGAEKFQRQLDEVFDVQVSLEFAAKAIAVYRTSHHRVVAFWRRLEQAFVYVVQGKKSRVQVQPNIAMGMTEVGGLPFAWIELPSGRKLYYAEPEMTADGVRYWGRNIYKGGQWDRVSTYGGKLAENITQAASRDVLAEAMLRLDDAGFKLILQVHDEVVAEVDENSDLQDSFKALMLRSPSWATGLPIDVECFTCQRYRK